MLLGAAEKSGNDRFKAILVNHNTEHEYICRKLGVVCSADVERISNKLKKPILPPKSVNLSFSNVRNK